MLGATIENHIYTLTYSGNDKNKKHNENDDQTIVAWTRLEQQLKGVDNVLVIENVDYHRFFLNVFRMLFRLFQPKNSMQKTYHVKTGRDHQDTLK